MATALYQGKEDDKLFPCNHKTDERLMRAVLVVILTLLLNACASSTFTPTPSASARVAFDGEVKVLTSYPAEGTYEHLGIVSVTGRTLADEQDLIELMAEIAAQRGANAIIVQGKAVKVAASTGEQLKMAATAIWQTP